jgi:MoxR-like ATPase
MTDHSLSSHDSAAIHRLGDARQKIMEQLAQVIVGQDQVIEELLISLFSRGHCLLEGVPGLAKTLMISTLARALNLSFSRIQFTPDLMPADITGTEIIEENRSTGSREFRFLEGPLFSNVILADEVNRTPPKTQAALLEAMQERQVTVGRVRHKLSDPFFVLATQNPIEQEGTYPLPEAQLDRFMFKLVVGYSSREELSKIVDRTTGGVKLEPEKVMDGPEIIRWQELIREVILADHVRDYIVRLTLATHPQGPFALPITNQYLRWGASPRGAQTLALAAKVRALLEGRYNVSFEDIRRVYLPALRHRVILNFEAQAENIDTDHVLLEILEKLPEKAEG